MFPRLSRTGLLAAGPAVLLWAIGMAGPDAVLLGLVVLTLLLVGSAVRSGDTSGSWPAPAATDTDGARPEVATLTWSLMGLDGRVSEEALRRLRADAIRRLARRGVVVPAGLGTETRAAPGNEMTRRARALLGDRAWRILTLADGRLPTLGEVDHCIDAIERLAPTADGPPSAGCSRPVSPPEGNPL
jgi:hypothetical protein